MNISLIESAGVGLLGRITGQKLRSQDITPVMVFMAVLVTVLLGVIFADRSVTPKEEQRLQKNLDAFLPKDEEVRQLAQMMMGGIEWHHLHNKPDELMTLAVAFAPSERLLLISLGYEMSASDGVIDEQERSYLQAIASYLSIPPRHIAVLEAGFSPTGAAASAASAEVRQLLNPAQFALIDDPAFAKVATHILSVLPFPPNR